MKIHHQAAIATTTKDDDPRSLGVEVGHTSDPPPQGGARQLSTGPPAMGNLATTDYVVDSVRLRCCRGTLRQMNFPSPHIELGNREMKIRTTLRSRGYDITRAEVVTSLVRQRCTCTLDNALSRLEESSKIGVMGFFYVRIQYRS